MVDWYHGSMPSLMSLNSDCPVIAEILLKVALNIINHLNSVPVQTLLIVQVSTYSILKLKQMFKNILNIAIVAIYCLL